MENNICQICKDLIKIKHTLPCNHSYCYICIRRHLNNKSYCPTCYSNLYTIYDLTSEFQQRGNLPKIENFFKRNEKNLRRELKKYNVNVKGDKDALEWRFNELCILVEAEKFKDKQKSLEEISSIVLQKERQINSSKETKIDKVKMIESLLRLKKLIDVKKFK